MRSADSGESLRNPADPAGNKSLASSAFLTWGRMVWQMAIAPVERRIHPRRLVSLMAEYESGRVYHPALVGDASEQGLNITILNRGAQSQFFPGKTVAVRVRISSGESISLLCEVRWVSKRRPPDGIIDSVGLQIINPSSGYVSFVKSLYLTP